MNKFLKGCLIVVLILVVLGTILGGIGWMFGGNRQINSMIRNGDLNYRLPQKYEKRFEEKVERYIEIDLEDRLENEIEVALEERWGYSNTLTGRIEKRSIVSQSLVRELELEIGGGALYLVETEDENFSIQSNTSDTYYYYMEEDTLVIQGLRGTRLYNTENEITLFVPKGFLFEEVDILLGGAYVEIESLQAQNLDISVGAGSVQIVSLEADEINLVVGAGEFIVENAKVRDADFELGVGRLSYEGGISGDLSASCAMGSMELLLDGTQKDHNYKVDGALGNIRIGDIYQAGMSMSKKINNNAISTFYLECGVGNMEIDFR